MKLKERLGEVMENSAMEKEDHPAPPAPAPQEAPKKKRGRPKKTAPAEGEDNIKMTIKEKGKVGRPKKYATAEEAKKAKTEKSVESNKRRAKEKAETAQMAKEDKPAEGKGLVATHHSTFVPKEFVVKARGLATTPSGSKIYPLTLGQVAKLARGIV
jgi:hypothetical protein